MEQIAAIQEQIKHLQSNRSTEQLPSVPMIPTLARTSAEMWQIYQYQLGQYQLGQCLPEEQTFLEKILSLDGAHNDLHVLLRDRLKQLQLRDKTLPPTLHQPMTSVRPMSHQEQIERAKLIAKHMRRAETSVEDVNEQIKRLQHKLMDLEEQWLAEQWLAEQDQDQEK